MKRTWSIGIGVERGGDLRVRVKVDGQELLPRGRPRTPLDALEYIDEGLVDFRRGDEIALSACYPPWLYASSVTRVRSLAILWCAEVLEVAFFEDGRTPEAEPLLRAQVRRRRFQVYS